MRKRENESQYAQDIEEGRLIVMRVEGKEKFNAGEAKALGHSLARHKADHLFNLDADNYLETADLVTLIETMVRQSNYVAQQYRKSTDQDAYGRILTTSALYLEVGGYHGGLSYFGGEDKDLIRKISRKPGVALIGLGQPARESISHGHDERLGVFVGHKNGMTWNEHVMASEIEINENPLSPLKEHQAQIWSSLGDYEVSIDHYRLTTPDHGTPGVVAI